MKMHLSKSEVVIKNGKVVIVTLFKGDASCGRKESGFRSSGSTSNRGTSGSIEITNYNLFSNYSERCVHCTAKYNELIIRARELKGKLV